MRWTSERRIIILKRINYMMLYSSFVSWKWNSEKEMSKRQIRIRSYLSSKMKWSFLRQKSSLILLFSLTTKILSLMINWVSWKINSKKTRTDFQSMCNKKRTYESESKMMQWSIWFLDFSKIRLSRTLSQRKFSRICIRFSMIRIVVLTL
jgi:hypothetical protein